MSTLLISGTNTEVGKTVLSAALLAYLQAQGKSWAIFKPLQTGMGDREFYTQLVGNRQPPDTINALHYSFPVAPPIAAAREGREIDLKQVWQRLQQLQGQYEGVLVEGLGGLGTPVTAELTVADLARDWRLPTLLVVPVQLGAIGQTVAHVALARQSGVQLKGLVLNCTQPDAAEAIASLAPPQLIESLTQVPVLGILPYFPDWRSDLPIPASLEAQWVQAVADLALEYIDSF
ncbi:ATP-dependent dethiobiotin synthetase BioD [Synechococcales cyanobacterium C]|uniref:ATP-dependent dethiobiotin synthetase BioD n=1 Tax=Petrachloros mirabilis ULC683 TaxID=2781853 RepID=A0A8K1ZWH2_9CYAN|nr:dethiobiotin synthase [Petrachloros mirabilis]NCJ05398.1 ATP-dependent dethiobiotin synthetase BioD [Petrachloros mirabilis ULC683]